MTGKTERDPSAACENAQRVFCEVPPWTCIFGDAGEKNSIRAGGRVHANVQGPGVERIHAEKMHTKKPCVVQFGPDTGSFTLLFFRIPGWWDLRSE